MKANEGAEIPDWITLNPQTGKYEGTAPRVEKSTNYSFVLHSEWTTNPAGTSEQIVKLTVGPAEKEETPINIPNDKPVAKSEAGSAGAAAAGAAVSSINAIVSGNPPTGIYFILHQLQLIILFLMIDPFIPDTLKTYLEGQGFALVNFNMIPSADIPGIDIPVDWLESEQTNEALSALGIESKSTLVNNLSLFLMIGFIIFIHVMLRYILV